MSVRVSSRFVRWLWAILGSLALSAAAAAPPSPTSSSRSSTSPAPAPSGVAPAARSESPTSDDPEIVYQKALDLERRRDWSAAIDVYQDALEQWPSRTEFSHRRRLCEAHYKLGRRYQDPSFRRILLRLPENKALDLYDEVVERILTNYVDPVSLEPLLRRGFDNLEVALRDPAFLEPNSVHAAAERVVWLRQALRLQRSRLRVADVSESRAQVAQACELARRALNVNAAPIVLEFAYGACDALDDYTSYLTPDKLDDLYAMIDGNFVGLGVELKLDASLLKIVGVIKGGPASAAGIVVGDRIERINGRAIRGLSLDEAATWLQGEEGTEVALTVLRRDGTRRDLRMTRRHVEVESISHALMLDRAHGIGYLHLTGFQKDSAQELDQSVSRLRQQGMKALIIDLRGNPGGLLNSAVEIAERFLDQGTIVSTRGRAAGQSQVYQAHYNAVWTMPLTILIDHDSASASEILAGALKDHRRAVVVGQRSFGKGSVQSIFSLRSAPAGLKLTTAKFYSPNNRPYSEQGVEPDIPVQIAAKPVAGGSSTSEADESPSHDPQRPDPTLQQALLQARRQLNAR
jgi:carboxyl-terminal processing protease